MLNQPAGQRPYQKPDKPSFALAKPSHNGHRPARSDWIWGRFLCRFFRSVFRPFSGPKAVPNPPQKHSFCYIFRRLVFCSIFGPQNPPQSRFLGRFGPVKSFKYIVITSVCSLSPFLSENRSADAFGPLSVPKRLPKRLNKLSKTEQTRRCFRIAFLLTFLSDFG